MLVVAVHGIGQQFKADAIIHREWWPAFVGGLHLAGGAFEDPQQFGCAFYGHLFRNPNALSATEATRPSDLKHQDELELLNLLWKGAAETEPDRVPPTDFYESNQTMAATPEFVQRGLRALSKSKFFAGIAENMMAGNLKQVVGYVNNPDIREKAIESVTRLISPETRVVLGHSLGSVVAYEALHRKPENVHTFVTFGSPLGIRNLIFDRLRPAPSALGTGQWPGKVRRWTNIADRGDVVANPKQLHGLFGDDVRDILVNNGSDAHHGERYLTAVETGRAVAEGLRDQ